MRTKTKGWGIAKPFIQLFISSATTATANTSSTLARVMRGNQDIAHQIRGNCPPDSCDVLKDPSLIESFTQDTGKRTRASIDYVTAKECLEGCPEIPDKLKEYFDGEHILIGSIKEEVERAFVHKDDEASRRLVKNCNKNKPLGKEISQAVWNLPNDIYSDVDYGSSRWIIRDIKCSWSYEEEIISSALKEANQAQCMDPEITIEGNQWTPAGSSSLNKNILKNAMLNCKKQAFTTNECTKIIEKIEKKLGKNP